MLTNSNYFQKYIFIILLFLIDINFFLFIFLTDLSVIQIYQF